MDENLIFDFKAISQLKEISIRLFFVDNINENEFGTLVFEAKHDNKPAQVTFSFVQEEIKVSNQMDVSTKSCLLLCGVNVIAPVLDCLRKHPTKWKKFKNCVKDQSITIASNAITCAAACFASSS